MRKKRGYKMKIAFIVVVVVLFFLIMIILPPSTGKIPQFYDNNGELLANSISEKCYLEVDDVQLGMIILAKDMSNPVLLVCGGGPGIPEYLLENIYPSKLVDEFTVCYLEYRGTGLSYNSDINISDMTTERYVTDILEVTNYLRKRFSQEKIYILGHSFGSFVAIKTIQQYPEYYYAYIAMSQICNQKESEYRAYNYMKKQYELSGNNKMLKKFAEYPIHESDEMCKKYFSSSLRDTAMHDLGVGTTHDMRSVITGIFFPSLKCIAYTWQERINIWRGKSVAASFPVAADCLDFNAFDNIKTLQIPIYFFAGKYDYTCCYSLQKEFYEQIDAPAKQFYIFENAAHSPIYEDSEKAEKFFQEILYS
ncbi:MAG: alpha/beta hydrolase [Lachnospiraceae bacterium]|nr:alpha/beta hydrolase [Lachnospiraceae bacterium]